MEKQIKKDSKQIEKLYGFHIELLDDEHANEVKRFYSGICNEASGFGFGGKGNAPYRFYGFDNDGLFDNRMSNELPIKTLKEAREIWQKGQNFFYDEPKEMMVWDGNEYKREKRVVIGEYNGFFVTEIFNGQMTIWDHVEPIVEPLKMTIPELLVIASEYTGRPIDQIKIID